MHTVPTASRVPELPAWLNPEFVTGEHLARRDDLTARLEAMLREHADFLAGLRRFHDDADELLDGMPDDAYSAVRDIVLGDRLNRLSCALQEIATFDAVGTTGEAVERLRAALS